MLNEIPVHAWSLDRTLGRPRFGNKPVRGLSLLELPAQLRAHGYRSVQLCHFHLPSQSPSYLADLRCALQESGVRLDALLVDNGDLTHPDPAQREADESWISGWIETGQALGAEHVRVVAGMTRTDDALVTSSAALGRLAARFPTMSLLTENWYAVTASAADVHAILEPLGGAVGVLIDLANWSGPARYTEFTSITRYAKSCHAKAHWNADGPDASDYRSAIGSLLGAGYTGPFALVYDADTLPEWEGLDTLRDIVISELAARQPTAPQGSDGSRLPG